MARAADQLLGRRDETCPVSTGGGTRRVQSVREGGGGGGGGGAGAHSAPCGPRPSEIPRRLQSAPCRGASRAHRCAPRGSLRPLRGRRGATENGSNVGRRRGATARPMRGWRRASAAGSWGASARRIRGAAARRWARLGGPAASAVGGGREICGCAGSVGPKGAFRGAPGCKGGAQPPPPTPSRTNWTRLVPPPVLTGQVLSLLPC